MIKRIVQNDQSQKNGEIGEILRRPHKKKREKKSRLRAFARTWAKNPEKQVKRDKLELLGWQELLDGKNIEKQIKRDKLERLRWQEILDEKNIEKQVKRDKLELLRWQEILEGKSKQWNMLRKTKKGG